jgi:hypothetical protein
MSKLKKHEMMHAASESSADAKKLGVTKAQAKKKVEKFEEKETHRGRELLKGYGR